jgi:hypothetical protein
MATDCHNDRVVKNGSPVLFEAPGPFRPIVDRLLSERPAPIGSAAVSRVKVSPRPRRPYSSLAHIELEFPDRCWTGYIKVARPSPTLEGHTLDLSVQLTKEFDVLCRLQASRNLQVVRPVAVYPDLAALVTEEVAGRDLGEELKHQLSRGLRRPNLAGMQEICDRCGKWLRAFQALTAQAGEPAFSLPEMREYIDRRLRKLTGNGWLGFSELRRQRLLRLFDSRAARVSVADRRVSGVHGDFGPGNVLVERDAMFVLDFSMYTRGSVYHDVTHFYHHLHLLAFHPRFSRGVGQQLGRAFLSGYEPGLSPAADVFVLFRIQHVLCQLSRLSTTREETWLSRGHKHFIGRAHLRWLDKLCASS